MKYILSVLVLLTGISVSYAQQPSMICLPVDAFPDLAANQGEHPLMDFQDKMYDLKYTLYVNSDTRSYTLTIISPLRPTQECIVSMGDTLKLLIPTLGGEKV
jgi:hypothetical protein|tara:strand:- start:42 stop:347 length:306 start_codon:yes stop_codon:yes gene_type:complete